MQEWVDVVYSYKILGEPDPGRKEFDDWLAQGAKKAENGVSLIFTRYWVWSISAYGTVEDSITADTASYQVFGKDVPGSPVKSRKTYLAWNPEKVEKIVRFSDGTIMKIRPGEVAKKVK